jgi:imidazolonepropionase-like amidohydrolase
MLLKNATVIDAIAPDPRAGIDVWVDGSLIRGVGARLSAVGKDVSVLDCAGRYLLPGLIDCHVHLSFDASPRPVDHLTADSDVTTLLKMASNARATLRRGVTTVRDLGSPRLLDVTLRDAIAKGLVPGPRMLVSGPVVTITGGHCHFMGHEADSILEIRRAVRANVKAGVDVIKVMATGGRLTPGSSLDRTQFSLDELSEAVVEAALAGRRVAMHTGGLEGIRRAVAAGAASIEHGSCMDEMTMLAMKEKGTVWVPTNAPAVRILLNDPGPDFPEAYLQAVRETWQARRSAVQRGIELGVRFASGTDAGAPSTEHGGTALEVKLFHDLGMPAMQAIWTATRWAAELLGMANAIGSIAVGRKADLILLSGDPLNDLEALARPDLVIQDGEIVYERGTAS